MAQRVFYTGTVQGVGFRRLTERMAAGYAVRGWVRNLPDGRVELLAGGADDEVERFLAAVRAKLAAHITAEAAETAADADLDQAQAGFVIRR